MYAPVACVGAVHHHPVPPAEFADHGHGDTQVVQPERGRFRHQQHQVRIPHGRYGGAGGARGRIQDDRAVADSLLPDGPDQGRGHRLADVEAPLDKIHGAGTAAADAADGAGRFADGAARADQSAGSAAVAELREQQRFVQDREGVETARLGAAPTAVAELLVHHGHTDAAGMGVLDARVQEERRVGRFDVQVEELHGQSAVGQCHREVHRHRGLTRAALAAGDGQLHSVCPASRASIR